MLSVESHVKPKRATIFDIIISEWVEVGTSGEMASWWSELSTQQVRKVGRVETAVRAVTALHRQLSHWTFPPFYR
jgi:hypothetical protein